VIGRRLRLPAGRRLGHLVETIEWRARAVFLASRDPRVSPLAKALAVVVAAYALAPIDLIPDVIPVLGLLDDLVLVPLGIALVVRMIPADVWGECLNAARDRMERPKSRLGIAAVLVVWVLFLAAVAWLVARRVGRL